MVREIDLGSPIAAILSKTMQTALVEAANLQTVGMGGLASAGYEDLLLNLTVAVLFPQVAAAMGHASPDCGPAVISAVRDYIRACAGEVVEMSVVASRFNISMRAMQENFRRYYGFSPRDYLTECRLDRAHQSCSPQMDRSRSPKSSKPALLRLQAFFRKIPRQIRELPRKPCAWPLGEKNARKERRLWQVSGGQQCL